MLGGEDEGKGMTGGERGEGKGGEGGKGRKEGRG